MKLDLQNFWPSSAAATEQNGSSFSLTADAGKGGGSSDDVGAKGWPIMNPNAWKADLSREQINTMVENGVRASEGERKLPGEARLEFTILALSEAKKGTGITPEELNTVRRQIMTGLGDLNEYIGRRDGKIGPDAFGRVVDLLDRAIKSSATGFFDTSFSPAFTSGAPNMEDPREVMANIHAALKHTRGELTKSADPNSPNPFDRAIPNGF